MTPCFDPVLMMRPAPPGDHIRRECLSAVDDPPQIDAQDTLPLVLRPEHGAARLNARVIHEDMDGTEALADLEFERAEMLDPADITFDCHGGAGALRCDLRQMPHGSLQPVLADIGNADLHPGCCEAAGGR